jgi:hypothetical protein
MEGVAGLVPSGTALGWAVPACFGDPRTGFRDHPVGTAPLRQAAGATSWPVARLDSGIEEPDASEIAPATQRKRLSTRFPGVVVTSLRAELTRAAGLA